MLKKTLQNFIVHFYSYIRKKIVMAKLQKLSHNGLLQKLPVEGDGIAVRCAPLLHFLIQKLWLSICQPKFPLRYGFFFYDSSSYSGALLMVKL